MTTFQHLKNTLLTTVLVATALMSLPAHAELTTGSLPRGMAIAQRTSSLLSMDTIEAVSLQNLLPGTRVDGQLQFLGASGQWYHTLLGATWTQRQAQRTQQLRASMVFTSFNGLYGLSGVDAPDALISHLSSFGLHYATRQAMPFVHTDFSMIYEAALQYNSMDLKLFPAIFTYGASKISTGLTRMEINALAQQDFPLRPYASLRTFAGLSLAYRHLSGDKFDVDFIGGQANLDAQNFLESRILGGVELEYYDENLIPELHLNARLSMGIRLNSPSIDSISVQDDTGMEISKMSFDFAADNTVDTQLALKARYALNKQLSVGANWTIFYQGNMGSSIGAQVSYAF